VANAEGQSESRTIRIGINNNAVAQVLSGLKAGERIVVGEAAEPTADSAQSARRRTTLRVF
jgi:membrane fusion protein, macrolide-specific efflux system